MGSDTKDRRLDHRGRRLPPGIYPQGKAGAISGYKARWREEDADGVPRNAAKSFSARKLGSLDQALETAVAFRVKRLAPAADAYGLERIVEAVLGRDARHDLLPLRDAAFIAAMGFTVAARPSEWLHSARWRDLHEHSVELQRPYGYEENDIGLKTGARAALLLSNAAERIDAYRHKLEAEFGPQPHDALVFQSLGEEGPRWEESTEGGRAPVPWSDNDYKRWTARIWRPARERAAKAPGAPAGPSGMRFYDCRHTAISLALHSTLVVGPYGMNLHNLAAWAGHDVQTLQRYYAHVIARYQGGEPIDLERECSEARAAVAAEPFKPPTKMRRGRSRRRGEREPPERRAAAQGSR